MIKVKKDWASIPPGLDSETCRESIARALEEREKHNANDHVYRHASVVDALNKIYHGKCGWCETSLWAGSTLFVDHYRPKKGVKGDDGHPGYYWLAYEWSNLIASCWFCNTKKSHSFPVADRMNRVRHPADDRAQWRAGTESLLNEGPLLLHPEIDFPEKSLSMDADGVMVERNESLRGKTTIEICCLNRDGLIRERKQIIIGFRKRLWSLAFSIKQDIKTGRIGKREFLEAVRHRFSAGLISLGHARRPKEQYSFVGKSMSEEFQAFFIDTLKDGDTRAILQKAFSLFSSRLQEEATDAAR